MCSIAHTYSVLRIDQLIRMLQQIFRCYGVYVVNHNDTYDIVSYQTELTAKIAGNNLSTKLAPHVRSVKYLIEVSEIAKGQFSYTTIELEILEPVVECTVFNQLIVSLKGQFGVPRLCRL